MLSHSGKCLIQFINRSDVDYWLKLTQMLCVSEQEVEYVKEEAKMVYLLECLQKTTPPVSNYKCM